MITTEMYEGQGFGNQLWSYVVTRVLAMDKKLNFGIQNPHKFKGVGFLNLDMGENVAGGDGPQGGPPYKLPEGIKFYYSEKVIRHPKNDFDIRTIDRGLDDLVDGTKIDGNFQAEEYIEHHKDEIRSWLSYQRVDLDIDVCGENICVINFRGGEYKGNASIYLRRKYWRDAVQKMKMIEPNMVFHVVTDDPEAAKRFFPKYDIRHYGIHGDYQAINSAPYLILSNSSFGFFPAWLNQNLKVCIAPKYWAAHNFSDGYWSCSTNITRDWIYLDRNGTEFSYDECISELQKFKHINDELFEQKKIKEALVLVSSFNNDLSWLPRYSDNYYVFERGIGSGIPSSVESKKVRFVPNNGSNFKDYFTYIIENYENLPEEIYLLKGNVFPRHVRQHVFDSYIDQSAPCSIIDKSRHRTSFPLDFFGNDGLYCELNSDWFVFTGTPWMYFQSLNDFHKYFDQSYKSKMYTRFSIGAEYKTTRDVIKRIPKENYEKLLEIVSHGGQPIGYTAECFIVERALDQLWSNDYRGSNGVMPKAGKLPIASDRKVNKRRLTRLFYTLIGAAAKVLNTTIVCLIFVKNFVFNRSRLIKNFWFS